MKKRAKFTNFLNSKENTHQPNKRMNRFIETNVLRKGFMALMLVFVSAFAYSQCAPQLIRSDGTAGASGIFCEGQLITFEANSPGHTATILWEFGDGPPQSTSASENPVFSFAQSGNYTVTFTGDGFAGPCTGTLDVFIRPSPDVHIIRRNDSLQCYSGNSFCFRDSSVAPGGLIERQRYVFSDGQDTIIENPTFPIDLCFNFLDPSGGAYDMTVESYDTSGCLTRIVYTDYISVAPKIGTNYANVTPPPNPACFQILGRFQNISGPPLSDIDSFRWNWGDGTFIKGNGTVNTEYYNNADNNIVEHLYTTAGTFQPEFIVSAYGCSDTFISQVGVVNIILEPKIFTTSPSCAPYQPTFNVTGLNGSPISQFLWNYGQPPWGNDNTNDQDLTPNSPRQAYGPGVYQISLRVVSGPCDVTVYDTIQVVGPGTGIESAGNRVAIEQTYQCIIEDTVCMTNASGFYQNDFDRNDEDSLVYYPQYSFDRIFNIFNGQYTFRYREWEEDSYGNQLVSDSVYALPTDTITEQGFKVYYDAAKDSIAAVSTTTGDTTWHKDIIAGAPGVSYRFGINNRPRFVFNYIPPPGGTGVGAGDQVAIPLVVQPQNMPNRDYRPNIWRVWTMGDNFAPQCTTDSRPWVNQNLGINCNYRIDSAPCHWYTPWDEIYRTFQDGRNYTQPYRETRINKNLKECYQVNVYSADTMIVPKTIVLTVPVDSSYRYLIRDESGVVLDSISVPSGGNALVADSLYNELDGFWVDTALIASIRQTSGPFFEPFYFTLKRPPSAFYGTIFYYDATLDTFFSINNMTDTLGHDEDSLGRNNPLAGNGSTKWTVTYQDMQFFIPAGVTLDLLKLEVPVGTPPGGAAPGSTYSVTGPVITTIEPNWQFRLSSGDSIFPQVSIEENAPDTTYAQPSNYVTQEVEFGLLVRKVKQAVFVDSAAHRENWFLENATCNTVTLWQMDTIHPLMCESNSTKQLALTPPSGKGMQLQPGPLCPFDGVNLNYILTFDISETKPGCTQQWFAVNYDTATLDPALTASWVPYDGGLLAPPPPGLPIPFVLPYDIRGNLGTQFVKGYTSGQIGDPYARNPIGSFSLGLIVGNGTPLPGSTDPARCLDTFYYPDMFRILPLDASFEIVYPEPTADGKYFMCAGDTAYFRFNTSLQDSIKTIRWNWGYPANGFGRGPLVSYYFEEFKYYQPYNGPVAGRNDENIVYNGEDWLYNYVIRTNTYALRREGLQDVFITDTVETIVTSIIKDWKTVAVKTNADQIIVDLFEQQLGLTYSEIPPEDIALYLGPAGTTCIDTTGLSQFFTFGKEIYSPKNNDIGVYRQGDKMFRIDTTVVPNQIIETQHILHFRDSSVIGFDTLLLDTNANNVKDTLTGLYRHVYRYKELVNNDDCNPTALDTVLLYGNGPMTPGPILNSTNGCEARAAIYLNVGFLNEFSLQNDNICNGLELVVDDYIRYYQYGEEDPFTYPIKTFDYWNDPARYVASPPLETFMADWDSTTVEFDSTRSLPLRWTYSAPGVYDITIVARDSIGCTDTTMLKAFVSEVTPDFVFGDSIVNCASIVEFTDSTKFVDPCEKECPDGTKLSCEKITSWLWDFGDGTRKSLLQNPSHNYTSGGSFTVTLIVTTELGCIDSIKKTVYIPGPQPEFGFRNKIWRERDTAEICAGDFLEIINFGQGDVNSPTFQMIWGDGAVDAGGAIGDTFGHVYAVPGIYELYIVQEDQVPGGSRCSRIFPDTSEDLLSKRKIIVIVYPTPEVTIGADPLVVCPDELITFTATMDARYSRISWIMGNGDTINEPDANNNTLAWSYGQPGTYSVILAPEYDEIPRCWDRDTIQVEVTNVTADFSIDSSARPEFCFTNLSSDNAVSFEWTFEETSPQPNGTSIEKDDCYNWDDRKGNYNVCLIATSAEGCKDTICRPVSNSFIRKLVPYNIFSPNGDLFNNTFIIEGESLDEYNIKIFNRWGERVFESNDINNSWNGQVNNSGVECPSGTYFYIINYTFKFGEENEGLGPIEGTVELRR